ncbi:hypothetical protein GCM10023197_28470 [Gordonia humi]
MAMTVGIVGLYHHPPENTGGLCMDEKSRVQALDRSQSVLPIPPQAPERATHDYVGNGVTSLFLAALLRTCPPSRILAIITSR